jgi:hypothetical protein
VWTRWRGNRRTSPRRPCRAPWSCPRRVSRCVATQDHWSCLRPYFRLAWPTTCLEFEALGSLPEFSPISSSKRSPSGMTRKSFERTRTPASPIWRSNLELDATVGGLAVLDRGIIGSRFSTAALQFKGSYQSFSPDSVLAAIEAGETIQVAPGALEQQLDGQAGYALAVMEYVVLCREYTEEETAKLVSSWGQAIFSETGQRNANIFASALPPNRKTSAQAKELVTKIAEGTE